MAATSAAFSNAHRLYVKSLYKRSLTNALNWYVRRDLWRAKAIEIRAEFERNRNIHDPRALAKVIERAESDLAREAHPDPYITAMYPGGTKWERNLPPPTGPIINVEAEALKHSAVPVNHAERVAQQNSLLEEIDREVIAKMQGEYRRV